MTARMMIGVYAQPGAVTPGASSEPSIMILATSLLSLVLLDQPNQADCEMPPRGSSQAVIDCYDDACAELQSNISNCDGNKECIASAMVVYQLDLALCSESVSTSEDLVVWFDGSRWAVAWPGDEFATASKQLKFNL